MRTIKKSGNRYIRVDESRFTTYFYTIKNNMIIYTPTNILKITLETHINLKYVLNHIIRVTHQNQDKRKLLMIPNKLKGHQYVLRYIENGMITAVISNIE